MLTKRGFPTKSIALTSKIAKISSKNLHESLTSDLISELAISRGVVRGSTRGICPPFFPESYVIFIISYRINTSTKLLRTAISESKMITEQKG